MNGADPLVSVTVSAALGIIVVGMAIAYLINKWRKKDDARNEAINGTLYRVRHQLRDLGFVYLFPRCCSACPILLKQVETWQDGHISSVVAMAESTKDSLRADE